MLMGKPEIVPPRKFDRSYAKLGVIAVPGKLVEVRTPNPDGGHTWPRIYLDEQAARSLMEWLPEALELALDVQK
jgi:hypothetical protein